jgi:hypothetical protein
MLHMKFFRVSTLVLKTLPIVGGDHFFFLKNEIQIKEMQLHTHINKNINPY